MLAIFGLILFSQGLFGFLSFTAEGGAVFGRSFLTAAAMMSLIALPLVVGATREALQAVPAPRARGLVRARQDARARRSAACCCRPRAPGIATGTALGMGRIAGDTAIVVILLGASLQLQGADGPPPLDTLRGTGSTLTSYVYHELARGRGRRAREGLRRGIRAAADRAGAELRRRLDLREEERGRVERVIPPPIRRIVVDAEPTVVEAPPPSQLDGADGNRDGAQVELRSSPGASPQGAAIRRPADGAHAHREPDRRVRRQGGGQRRRPARSARARCSP